MTNEARDVLIGLLAQKRADQERQAAPLEAEAKPLRERLAEIDAELASIREESQRQIDALNVVLGILPDAPAREETPAREEEEAGINGRHNAETNRNGTAHVPPINDLIIEVLREEGAILRNSAIKQRAKSKYPSIPRAQTVQEQVSRLAKEGRLDSEIFGKARYFGLPEWKEGAPSGAPFHLRYIPKRLQHHLDMETIVGQGNMLSDSDTQHSPAPFGGDGAT